MAVNLVLKPIINKIGIRISKIVAITAKSSPIWGDTNELIELLYLIKFCQLPQATDGAPTVPQRPNRSATADRNEIESATRRNNCENLVVSMFNGLNICQDKIIDQNSTFS